MVAVIGVLAAAVVCLFTYLFIQLEKKRKKFDQFAGPRSLPIIGNVHQMKRSATGNVLLYKPTLLNLFIKCDLLT